MPAEADVELSEPGLSLVKELRERLGLSERDAMRSAFTVLAYYHGWPEARIARYLGTTRQRVSQRISKYRKYAKEGGPYGAPLPLLSKYIKKRRKPRVVESKITVGFRQEDWDDLSLARILLNRF